MNSEVGVQTGSIRRNAPRSIYDPRQAAAHRAPGPSAIQQENRHISYRLRG